MIKKLMVYMGLILLLVGSVLGTLMYSEDFESYELNNETWHTVDNTWFCEDLAPNNCKETVWGAPPATSNATQFISSDVYGNKYLLLWSWGADNNGGKGIKLLSNITPDAWISAKNWSVQYDILHVWSDHSSLIGLPTAQQNSVAGLFLNLFGSYTDGDSLVSYVGGKYNDTSQEDFERLRIKWNPPNAFPISSLCDVNDGNWHKVTQHYIYNTGLASYDATDVYIDETLCTSFTATLINPSGNSIRYFRATSSSGHLIYMDNIKFHMDELAEPSEPTIGSCVTTCDSWSLPYYMVEGFVGQLYVCDWLNNHNSDCMLGELDIPSNYSNYYAQKDMDLIEADNTRYATVQFNLNLESMPTAGSTFSLRLYDSDAFNFITAYVTNWSQSMFYDGGGVGTDAFNITLGDEVTYKFVIDLNDDIFDIYYNGSLLLNDGDFADAFVNIVDIQTFKIVSSYTGFVFDDLYIYASDEYGNILMPDEGVVYTTPNSSIFACGLFYNIYKDCDEDSDCITGKCTYSGQCHSFDFNYCDGVGRKRNTWCMVAGLSKCFLTSIGDLILDNFFLFLVLLLLIMGIVYLKIMMK